MSIGGGAWLPGYATALYIYFLTHSMNSMHKSEDKKNVESIMHSIFIQLVDICNWFQYNKNYWVQGFK